MNVKCGIMFLSRIARTSVVVSFGVVGMRESTEKVSANECAAANPASRDALEHPFGWIMMRMGFQRCRHENVGIAEDPHP